MKTKNTGTKKETVGMAPLQRFVRLFSFLKEGKDHEGLAEEELPSWWTKWQTAQEKFPLGKSFNYLGRQMIVVSHRRYFRGIYTPYGSVPMSMPAILAEYADNRGTINTYELSISMANIIQV